MKIQTIKPLKNALFEHLPYEKQIAKKASFIQEVFQKQHIKTTIHPILKNESPTYYRHKVVASAVNLNNRLRLGLYVEGTKTIRPNLDHHIHDKKINETLKSIQQIMQKYKIHAYDGMDRLGVLKHVMIRKSLDSGQMIVVLVTQGHILPNVKAMIKDIIFENPDVSTIVQNIHNRKTPLVLLDNEKVLHGDGYIYDKIDGLSFRLSAKSFYQVNPKQMIHLYQKVLEYSALSKDEVVMDCYSGIGTISLLLSKVAKHVHAVEVNPISHQNALFNKKHNQITNVSFYVADVEKTMETFKEPIDVLVMDPTRDGASPKFLEALIKLKPKRIVYVSCDVITLSRDLSILSEYYDINEIQPVDMFSYTAGIENVCRLTLKKEKRNQHEFRKKVR